MIKKIKTIKNLAVFQNFEWDRSVTDKNNDVCELKSINILYGMNYSGKTTLSRIFRAMQTGNLSDKYKNPEFCVSIKDEDDVTQNSLKNHNKKIRVFNEDFVRDNLRFISDPNESIEPFAILGADNNIVEKKITALKADLGSQEEGKETGLYADLKRINTERQTALTSYETATGNLDVQLSNTATNNQTGIKYKSEQFGDQNYDKRKLKSDIHTVLKDGFEAITNEKQTELNTLLKENPLDSIPSHPKISLQFNDFSEQTKQLVEKEIGVSNKIQNIVKDAVLSSWVKEGIKLHKDKLETCAFCDNEIKESRWSELDKHFDEESNKLEQKIDELLKKIQNEKELIAKILVIEKHSLYSKFHTEFDSLSKKYNNILKEHNTSLDNLNEQLVNRKNNLIQSQIFKKLDSVENKLIKILDEFEQICTNSNDFTNSLNEEQTKARASLRLREVFDFTNTIKYSDRTEEIKKLKEHKTEIISSHTKLNDEISSKTSLIEDQKKLLKDESKGANKVNEYLNSFFGHKFLSLKSVEFQDEENTEKTFKFEVTRDDIKAYHLSEGEKNLISFCYFMGRLEDVETKDTKSIIWIDDPVSSLDGNHIFFVYSLIKAKIVDVNIFEQLFISTHSLEFLKYLKRLNRENCTKSYFIVNRTGKNSTLELMPEYLKEYITEFNYLFEQIHKCSSINEVDDTNYSILCNFGNNARKFLEIFLYYKYPDNSKQEEKLKKFFDTEIPAIITSRINHEYSHLSGCLERGATPVVAPEMKLAATLILKNIKRNDEEQYESLLKSIGQYNDQQGK